MNSIMMETFSSLRIIELLEIKKSLRDYARWVIPKKEHERYKRIISSSGIKLLSSEFSLVPIESSHNIDEPFHEYMRSASKNNAENAHIVLYLSKDNPMPLKIAEGDHGAMGRLLGYPICCIRSFMEYHNNPGRIMSKEMLRAHERIYMKSEVLAWPYYLNLMKRHKGYSVLSHIPCSLHCEKTHDIGLRRELLLQNHDYNFYEALRKRLCAEEDIRGKRFVFY